MNFNKKVGIQMRLYSSFFVATVVWQIFKKLFLLNVIELKDNNR